MSKHTPGPETEEVVARGLGKANARLIAAAPELLAACQRLLSHYDNDTRHQWTPAWKALRAAIAKAEDVS